MWIKHRMIYLDANATTPMSRRVISAFSASSGNFGNPSSRHPEGHRAAVILQEARLKVAKAIDGEFEGVYFTSGATEANNTVIRALPRNAHVVHTAIEHPSVLTTCTELHGSAHLRVSIVPVTCAGVLDETLLERALRPDTLLVCVIPANNEIGVVQNLRQVIKLVRGRSPSAMVHMDCTQCLGKMPLSVKRLGADYATFSAHKCHGPKGVGVLYVRPGARPVTPLLTGGHQERELRAGTEPVPLIWCAAVAIEDACCGVEERARTTSMKRDYMEKRLVASVQAVSNCCHASRLANTLSLRVPGVNAVLLVDELSSRGVCVGMGSACSKGQPSYVLKSIGLSDEQISQTIRVSLLHDASWLQVREACRAIEASVAKLRQKEA